MKNEELGPLPSELASLLAQERSRPSPPMAEGEATLERVLSTIGLSGPPGGSGEEGPAGPAITGSKAGSIAGGTAGLLSGLLRSSQAVVAAAAFIAGGITGAGVYAVATRTPSATTPPMAGSQSIPARVAVTSTDAATSAASVDPASSRSVSPVAQATSAPRASGPTGVRAEADAGLTGRDDVLASERALLETARTAILRGEPAAALEAIERHARQFPRGRLAEERESLRVQALAGAGRWDEARAKGKQFQKLYPESVLGPSVDIALDGGS